MLLSVVILCLAALVLPAPTKTNKEYYDYYADNGDGVAIDFVTIAPEPETSTHKHRHNHHHLNKHHLITPSDNIKLVVPQSWSKVADLPNSESRLAPIGNIFTHNPITALANGIGKLFGIKGNLGFNVNPTVDRGLQLSLNKELSLAGWTADDTDSVVLSPNGPEFASSRRLSVGGIELGIAELNHQTQRIDSERHITVKNCRQGHLLGLKFSNCDSSLLDSQGLIDVLDVAQILTDL